MHKLDILCDLDDVVVDLLGRWLEVYNRDYGDKLTKKDLWDFEIWKCVSIDCGSKIYDYIQQPGFFKNLKPLPGAVEMLQKIKEDGHDITIVSAPAGSSHSFSDKALWIKRYLPFLDVRQDVFVGGKKHRVTGDIIIDDSPINIKSYREKWPNSKILTIAYEFNKDVSDLVDLRALGYNNTEKAWEDIYKHIKEMSDTK